MRIKNDLWTAGNEIQTLAEELAEAKYARSYYDLTQEEQTAVYEQAAQVYREGQ